MATRQYVGARYVPKLAEPLEWNSALQYEGLTIVTYGGNSFTSRKPVPVGIDIANTEYWANTGAYNAQLNQLELEINALNTRADGLSDSVDELGRVVSEHTDSINELKNKKILFVGDSYNNPDRYSFLTWGEIAGQALGVPYKSIGHSGAGFIRPSTDGYTFVTVLEEESDLTYTDIVICGGLNDTRREFYLDVAQGVTNVCNYIKTKWTNAKIHLGYNGYKIFEPTEDDKPEFFRPASMGVKGVNTQNLYAYIYGCEYAVHAKRYLNPDDGLSHPTANGMRRIASTIIRHFCGGMGDTQNQFEYTISAGGTRVTDVNVGMNDGTIHFTVPAFSIRPETVATIQNTLTFDAVDEYDFNTVDTPWFISLPAVGKANGALITGAGRFYIADGNIPTLNCYLYDSTGTRYSGSYDFVRFDSSNAVLNTMDL